MKKNLFYAIIAALFLVGCGEGGSSNAANGVGSDGGGVATIVPSSNSVENAGDDDAAGSSGSDTAY